MRANRLTVLAAVMLALVASFALAADDKTTAVPKTTAAFDKTDMDTTVSACADFNEYANGGWLKKNPIPPAYSSWGVANVLAERNRDMLRAILERAAKSKATPGSIDQKIGDYYTSCMDETTIEEQGLKPLQPELNRIDAIKSVDDLQTEIARPAQPAQPAQPADIATGSGPTRARSAPDVFGNIFIGIAGMIGAGKSTLATALGQHLGIDCYYEPVAGNVAVTQLVDKPNHGVHVRMPKSIFRP